MTPQSSSLLFGGGAGGDEDAVELADVVVVEDTMVDKVVGAGGAGGAATSAFTFVFATLLTMSTSLVEPEPVLGGGVDVGAADEDVVGAGAGLLPEEEPPPHISASSVE